MSARAIASERRLVEAVTGVQQLVELVREQHRPLRMSARECEQLVHGTARPFKQTVRFQQPGDVLSGLVDRQWTLYGEPVHSS